MQTDELPTVCSNGLLDSRGARDQNPRSGSKQLRVTPCTLAEANKLVALLHRHHKPVVGHRFSLAVYDGPKLCGVVICGRPVARMVCQKTVLEISRCATDGTKNAITKLYSAVCRAAQAMGFASVQTYTLPEEGGASLKAAGFTLIGKAGGGDWNRGGESTHKNRRTDQPMQVKWKWARKLNGAAAPAPLESNKQICNSAQIHSKRK